MSTSGSYTWTQTRSQVIKGALRKIGVLPSGGTPTANQTSDASDALNAIIKTLQADGMPVWAMATTSFTVSSGINTYSIGPGLTVNVPATPLKVVQAQRTILNGENVPLDIRDRYDFNALPINSTVTGTPVALYYQPLSSTTGGPTGTVNLWPNPNDSTTVITLDYQRPYSDMNADTDNLDFPSYWVTPLIYLLAWSLAPEYGIPPIDRGVLQKEAEYWHQYALSFGAEEGSVFMTPSKYF